jgi:hypothetical protein
VDGGAVVALHEVLDDELPVGLDVVAHAAAETEVFDLVAVDRLDVAESITDVLHDSGIEGGRIVAQIDPDVPEPFLDRHRSQAVANPIDVGHLGEIRCCDELSVEIVGPGVVRTLERSLDFALVLHADSSTAVRAHVQVGLDRPGSGARHDDTFAADLHGAEGTGLVQIGGTDRADPQFLEDLLLLELEDGRIGVVATGKGGDEAFGQGKRGCGRRGVGNGGHGVLRTWPILWIGDETSTGVMEYDGWSSGMGDFRPREREPRAVGASG